MPSFRATLCALELPLLVAGCPGTVTLPADASDVDGGGIADAAIGVDAPTMGDASTPLPDAAVEPDAALSPDAAIAPDAAETCPTPGTIENVPCGMCGTNTRFCTVGHVWQESGCTHETGACSPGSTSLGTCGRCGQQAQFCSDTCQLVPMGACLNETGACLPGSTTRVSTGCPTGQTRPATCSDACEQVLGDCSAVECEPGAIETVACGRCGMQDRTCDTTGHWVDGMCLGEGVCAPGATTTTSCQVCGTQTTTCTASCTWGPPGACVGGVTCGTAPADTCVSATTLRTFAPECQAGACVYVPSDLTCSATCMTNACTGGAILVGGLGGAAGFGPNVLPSNDDGSSAAIDLSGLDPMGLNYWGTRQTRLFVNNNGSVSFGAMTNTYSPVLPGSMVPLIEPWGADVDTRGGGQPAHNVVAWYVDATRLVATWYLVGTFSMNDSTPNSFQVILTPRGDRASGDFDVEMRYAECHWLMGQQSPSPAVAGFDAGDHTRAVALPGSGTPAMLDLCATSNVGTAGVWRYEVRNGTPVSL